MLERETYVQSWSCSKTIRTIAIISRIWKSVQCEFEPVEESIRHLIRRIKRE